MLSLLGVGGCEIAPAPLCIFMLLLNTMYMCMYNIHVLYNLLHVIHVIHHHYRTACVLSDMDFRVGSAPARSSVLSGHSSLAPSDSSSDTPVVSVQ